MSEKDAVDQIETSMDQPAPLVETADRELEKKLLRKLDVKLIPPLFVLLMASFIDRVNIGNARLLGLEADLKLEGNQYNIALFVFFIPYVLLEVPANLILKKMRPSYWLPSLILGFGTITMCQGFTQSYAGLVICRFLIGVFEAGYFPGAIYLISMYYKRHELQVRVNFFFSAAILAGAFSGLLAYAIGHMGGIRGYNPWSWVFILEGVATVMLAIVSHFLIPDWPETSTFLEPSEKKLLLSRLAEDSGDAQMSTVNRKAAKRVFSDLKIYLGFLIYFACTTTAYAMALFIPTILHDFGWSPLRTQVMTIPVYIVAAVMCVVTAFVSDRVRHRCAFIAGWLSMGLVAWIILINAFSVSVGVRYMAIFFAATATNTAMSLSIVWLNNNMGGHFKRAVAAGMQIGLGNTGGIVASNVFLRHESPFYHTGYSVGIGALCLGLSATAGFLLLIHLENKRRDRGERDYLLQLPDEELRNLGDDHPSFRYTY
ncbi:uncharacterized protein A1O9_12731 [Exophiala aquamarina CBS 119918]|uniref:Major facilitator superfamily (MFS) profile domain-containing protein n=1 Tax=Exophiala aquamarina CBS 119918 TaxID=1182545 RepID=A0A072NW27_9EURO|nr:uncharacterized protein A1O9_12731 [Exophiala aquamarina CBS 119918]KEF51228.1 hypothetical protein A1O9_12731 [Exophiala aquamarina CBS 119918]